MNVTIKANAPQTITASSALTMVVNNAPFASKTQNVTVTAKPAESRVVISNIAGVINLGGDGAMYKTSVDYQVISYDSFKGVYYTNTTYNIEGDPISFIIQSPNEDFELIGAVNIVGKKIEFQSDFDCSGLKARVTYLRFA